MHDLKLVKDLQFSDKIFRLFGVNRVQYCALLHAKLNAFIIDHQIEAEYVVHLWPNPKNGCDLEDTVLFDRHRYLILEGNLWEGYAFYNRILPGGAFVN